MASCQTKVETKVTENVDKEKIKSDIATLETAYAEGLNTRNIDLIMPYYAENAENYESGNAPLIGKAAIKMEVEKDMTQMPAGMKIQFTTKDLHISADGINVMENGSYMVADAAGKKVFGGHFMAYFEKKDGKYQCVREMITADQESI